MALQITNRCQVGLNGLKYTIAGQVHSQRISRSPSKIITGSAEYANEQFLSNWITKDQRGGLLVDEMDESVDADRYWWSTCDTRFPGHLIPNQLATEIPIPNWASPTGTDDPDTAWTDDANAINGNIGNYAFEDTEANTYSKYLEFTFSAASVISVAAYLSSETDDMTQVSMDYSLNGTDWTNFFEGAGINDAYNTHDLNSGAPVASVIEIRIKLYNDDDAVFREMRINNVEIGVDNSSGTVTKWKEFNSETYMATGAFLNKIDSTALYYELVREFSEASITDLEVAFGELIITLGDADEYYHMTTAESFSISSDANNTDQWTKCIYWSGKLYGCKSDGTMTSCTTAGGSTTAADASGGLDELVDDNDLQRLFTHFKSD
ncbi:hypothetical protein LCGC14_2350970 [marine sediment metagenome]|uniref:Uncharacterized protein n=1 Tax=marine sediment metagenome TaxID=412755 RepID=A0A0F9C953_9ZZZZ